MKRSRDDDGAAMGGKRDSFEDARSRERLTTSDALSYLREVKTRFANNRKVYDSFLEIMKQFKAQSIDTTGVIKQVKTLFHGHPELILGFNTFLPKGYEIRLDEVPKWQPPPKAPVEFDQAITYVNKIKQRFATDERVYKAFLEILNMYRKGQKTIAQVYDEVALLFHQHNDLLSEFTYFLPDNSPPTAQPRRAMPAARRGVGGGAYGAVAKQARRAPPPLRRDDPKVQRELAFFEKVKHRLRNREAYNDFLKCLNLFAEDVVAKQELVSLVHDIIGRHHDLMAGLNEFLMRCELGPEDPYSRPYQARDRSRHANLTQKYISLPISELDVSTWERTTPSYVLLPASYPRLKATGRDPMLAPLLNDEWVSVTSGSEDYNFKHYRKNQYEDFLFMAEDDHFELDMIIDQSASAIKAMTPIVAELEEMSEEERASWVLPDGALRAFHYRAVCRIYGEQGSHMVSLLRQNPAVALPTVLPRLMQKDEEWRATKAEMMIQWQAIFKENYNKSLDHRSFYFKQSEKKSLTPKALFAEIKEVADRRKNEKVSVLLALTGRVDFAARLAPHLSADYSEYEVQMDASRIMQMGIDNMLTADAASKVRTLHHSFLETFLELGCTCGEAEERRKSAAADGNGADGEPAVGTTPRAARVAKAGGEPSDTEAEGAKGEDADDELGGLAALKGLAAGEEPETGTEAETSDDERTAAAAANAVPMEVEEEEADETDFVNCRPVVPLVAGAVGTPPAPTSSPGPDGLLHPHCRMFYGNESLYVLLRLHQILYERLKTARSCAAQKAAEGEGDAATLHSDFMAMVQSLIEGRTDPSVYEDDCRSLLGTSSYQLFTLDKLVHKLVKHAQACLAEEPSVRLLDLWRYENSRGVPVMDSVYHSNARIVLGDEAAIRFELNAERKMIMQYMEGERGDAPPILEPGFRGYVESYVDGEQAPTPGSTVAGEDDGGKAVKVCLQRNLSRVGLPEGADPEIAAAEALTGTALVNGLECKLGSTAQHRVKKIAYVLGTEDYFCRKKEKKALDTALEEKRAAKFHTWVESKAEAPAPVAAVAAAAPDAAAAVPVVVA